MNQVQVSIPAATQAPVVSTVSKAVANAFPQVTHVLMNRPQRGNALFAHTAAAFEALGLSRGESIPRQTMLRVWGETALKYHAAKFDHTESGYSLNDEGFSFFQEARTVDPEQAAVFFTMLTTGKGGEALPRAYQAVKPL